MGRHTGIKPIVPSGYTVRELIRCEKGKRKNVKSYLGQPSPVVTVNKVSMASNRLS
jgi:hypothetical protein